jgi:hypothetical protein
LSVFVNVRFGALTVNVAVAAAPLVEPCVLEKFAAGIVLV